MRHTRARFSRARPAPLSLLAAGLPLLLAAGILGPAPLRAQETTISGRTTVVWGDPPDGPATRRWYLVDTSGRTFQLHLEGLPESRVEALDGREVRVSGVIATDPAAPPGATPTLYAGSLDFLDESVAKETATPVYGSQPWISLACRFADVFDTPKPISYFETQLGETYPQLGHYWREASYDQMDIAGSRAHGWYDLPLARSAYVSSTLPDLMAIARDCARAAEADVYFPDFVGINLILNANIGCCAYGGGVALLLDGQTTFYRATWMSPSASSNLALVAHEMGHAFGLPHSSGPYKDTYDSRWDVMSGGEYCGVPEAGLGCVPVHTIAFHKNILGWIPSQRAFTPAHGTVTPLLLEPLSRPATAGYLMVTLPVNDTLFYTLETRRLDGYDAGVPAEGVVIHRVTWNGHAYVVDCDADGDPNDEGAVWTPGETFVDHTARTAVTIDAASASGTNLTILYDVELPTQRVDVVVAGARGTVSSDPVGIFCRDSDDPAGTGDCSEDFTLGSRVWLTATPLEGDEINYRFTGWTGGCESFGPTCLLFVSDDVTVSATFEVVPPAIALSAANALRFLGMTGMDDPSPVDVEITNSGGSPLTDLEVGPLEPSQASEWLSAALDRPQAPAVLSVTPTVAALPPGIYQAAIPISSDVAVNSPRYVQVVLTVARSVSLEELAEGLIGDQRLPPEVVDYIDSRANANGHLDVGDFLWWLDSGGPAASSDIVKVEDRQ